MALDRHAFESYPPGELLDETDINLRAYFAVMDEAKLAQYDPSWTNEQVLAWDENFKNDGALMLICSERDIEVDEYRRVLELYLEFAKTAARA